MLELKHISKTYKTAKGVKTQALKDINLRFPEKGMVFVLGKSGSGKSTLLNIIGGLDQSDNGEIIISGKSSKEFSQSDYDSYRNTYVGFIFQEFNLMDEYTIEKNIAMALQLQQKEATHEQIEKMLERLGLGGYAARYPSELSGGQKQRVAIARALIKEPEILMADEPTGALDSTTGKEIFDTLKELSEEKLVIVVSHDRESAQMYADRIIEFKDGYVESDNAPEVEEKHEDFKAIHSYLPFKDSFHLGFSCLGHKKIRMIFTIILTSFALLSLALSDAIGNFSSVNAQNKAAIELNETMAGIRYQYIDKDGNIMYYNEASEIKQRDMDKVLKENADRKFAKVYSMNRDSIQLNNLGIDTLEATAYIKAVKTYLITEMNSFDDLGLKDVKGTYPKDNKEVAISSYLAEIMMSQGIADKNGKMLFPKSENDIVNKIEIPVANQWLKITGIVHKDYSKYNALKKVNANKIDGKTYRLFREFSNVINMNGDKLYVKEGFVKSLQLKKGNVLESKKMNMYFDSNENQHGINGLAYAIEKTPYFDGEKMSATTGVKKNEILITPSVAMSIVEQTEAFYSDSMVNKSSKELRTFIQDQAKRLIGKTMKLNVDEMFDVNNKVISADVKIIGVLLPEGDFKMDDIYKINNSIVNKDLIESHIPASIYVSELLTNTKSDNLKSFLGKYDIDKNLYANTVATADVMQIKSMANVMTKIFFYVSIAFFVFAALLMMNFIIVSISYRKKDIGILRAIGARSTDVLKIFIWEGVVLAAISYIIMMAALFVVTYFVNNFAQEEIGILISPIIITLRQPVLMLGIVTLVTFIACVFPVTKIARQRPIDAIKK